MMRRWENHHSSHLLAPHPIIYIALQRLYFLAIKVIDRSGMKEALPACFISSSSLCLLAYPPTMPVKVNVQESRGKRQGDGGEKEKMLRSPSSFSTPSHTGREGNLEDSMWAHTGPTRLYAQWTGGTRNQHCLVVLVPSVCQISSGSLNCLD